MRTELSGGWHKPVNTFDIQDPLDRLDLERQALTRTLNSLTDLPDDQKEVVRCLLDEARYYLQIAAKKEFFNTTEVEITLFKRSLDYLTTFCILKAKKFINRSLQ